MEIFRAPVTQVSPELVLVDPELASEARSRLSDRPWEDFLPAPPPPEPPVVLADAPAAPAVLPHRRRSITVTVRIPIAATLWAVGLLAVLTTLAFGLVPGGGQGPSLASTTQAASPPPAPPQTSASPPPISGLPVVPPPPAPPAPSFRPARTFAWTASPDATYYSVVFTRDGKRFFSATPERPRVVLPENLKFGPGAYSWVVRPGFGVLSEKRLGKPLVQSRFTVTG